MAEDASHQVARQVVAKLCLSVGWQGIQNGACDVLADLMKRYILALGKTTAAYVANANRTEPAPSDVAYAFKEMGVSLSDLSIYARLVDSSPLPPIPCFPLPRHSSHIYSPPSTPVPRSRPLLSLSEEDEEGEEEEEDIIPPYFPPLPSNKADDDKDETESGIHDSADRDEMMDVSDPLATPADPNRGLPQLYRSRSRLSSEFSEEGGEGGSRRGSFSDTSTASRGVPTTEAVGSQITASAGEQNCPVVDDVIQKTQPLQSVSSLPSGLSSIARRTRPVEVSLVRTTSVPALQTSSLHYLGGDRRISEPNVRPVALPATPEQGSRPNPSLTLTRPHLPPLHLMSSGRAGPLPIASPTLPSPGFSAEGVRPSLPPLSPLCTTPTLSHATFTNLAKPQTVTPTGAVVVASMPQLMPTMSTQITPPLPPLVSPNSAHLVSEGITPQIDKESPLAASQPHSPPSDTGANLEPVPAPLAKQPPNNKSPLNQAQQPALLPQSPPDKLVASEELMSTDLGSVSKPESEDLRSQLSNEDSPSLPPFSAATSQELLVEKREESTERQEESTERHLSPEFPLLPPASPVPLRVSPDRERDEELGQKREEYVESIASSLSSKPPSPEIPPNERNQEPDEKTSFTVQVADGGRLISPKDGTSDVTTMGAVENIDMEGGGEGGVASILYGEEEMELPDIEKQLEMSGSEDSSSSSGSDEEVEPTAEEDVLQSEEVVDLRKGLVPPTSVRSSSHSLASTPSVSPSPSPIPHSSPLPSQHSVPILSADPVPNLKPPLPVPPTREEKKTKAVFSGTPATSVPATDSKCATGSLVVSFKKNLIASLCKRKEGSKRTRTKQQQSSLKLSREPVTKLKKPLVTLPTITPPDIVIEPPYCPLVVSISRSRLLHYEPLGLTSTVQQTGFVFSDEDDDDMIVTHSSAEQVKFKPPTEGVKPEVSSDRVKSSRSASTERVTVPQQQFSRHTAASPLAEVPSYPEVGGAVGGVMGVGVWKRELDISEMGLLPPAPQRVAEEQVEREGGREEGGDTTRLSPSFQVKVIPQSSSSSSSSGDSDSESGSDSSSHSSPSPLPVPTPTLPPSHSPTPSPRQQPMRSEDEESTSSSAAGGRGGTLKLKLRISKALLQNVAPNKPEKRGRKRGPATAGSAVPMATTPHGSRRGDTAKRGRPSKGSGKSSRRGGSNIPQIKLPKLELPLLPPPRQQATPLLEESGVLPLTLPPVAVSPGGEVWYCPQCTKPDDGSPMIGCDGSCEGWYHWNCVGIVKAPPETEKWFCPTCARKAGKKSRKRKP